MHLYITIGIFIFALSNSFANDFPLTFYSHQDNLVQRAGASPVFYSPSLDAELFDGDCHGAIFLQCQTVQQLAKPLQDVATMQGHRHLTPPTTRPSTNASSISSKSILNKSLSLASQTSPTRWAICQSTTDCATTTNPALFGHKQNSFVSSPQSPKRLGTKTLSKMKRIEVNIGDRFGRLTVVHELPRTFKPSGQSMRRFLFQCDCGNQVENSFSQVRSGKTVSCGCRMREAAKEYVDGKKLDMVGKTFGHLTVIAEVQNYYSKKGRADRNFLCRCDCGNEVEKYLSGLVNKKFTSCGKGCVNIPHRMSGTPIKQSYHHMMQRCNDPENKSYKNYGGRGIKICERWSTFSAFLEDMKATWFPGATLERNEVNGDYTPENCRWIPMSEQSKNRRCVNHFQIGDKLMTFQEIAAISSVQLKTIKARFYAGWNIHDAMNTPVYNRRN